MRSHLRNSLRLRSLLCRVRSNTLRLDALGLLVHLVVGAKEIDLIVVVLSSSRGSGRADERLAGSAGAGQGVELGGVGLDVRVPARDVWVGRGGGRGGDRLEDGDVGLGRDVAMVRAVSADAFNKAQRGVRVQKAR